MYISKEAQFSVLITLNNISYCKLCYKNISKRDWQRSEIRQYRRKVRQSVTDGLPFRWRTDNWRKHWITDGQSADGSDFRPSPESSVLGSPTVPTEGPSVTEFRFAGRLTTDGNIETVRNTDGISADWSDFRPSPESSLSKCKTTHYINLCVTALRLMWYDSYHISSLLAFLLKSCLSLALRFCGAVL